jgi:hypothetical protein
MAVVEMPSGHHGSPAPHLQRRRGDHTQSPHLATCQIVHAHSDDRLLTWSYTAGLCEAYGHPEFLLTGLDSFLADSVLSQLAEQVSLGHSYSEADLGRDLLHRLTCAFREVPIAMATVLMPLAGRIVDGQPMRTLQCIYPDNHNRLPWHFGYNTSWHDAQPLFTEDIQLTRVEVNLLRAAAGIKRPPARHRVGVSS